MMGIDVVMIDFVKNFDRLEGFVVVMKLTIFREIFAKCGIFPKKYTAKFSFFPRNML